MTNNSQYIAQFAEKIYYSEPYEDERKNLYRHVILPLEISKYVPKNKLLSEGEWRDLGVMQSRGWRHYMVYKPEPHILLFKKAHSL
ncbi:cyclin-dependent kinase regulatory subunit CKS1 [Nematocida displodere]|uniref:Cyclin-dependent kinases regulatory subunit n=1 Tax=Nematocida displodere TaxID=1805483 RepID=A0A177EJI1_9MICR|nr:cyclin-dependent kinase regulatory subunit CKS1 [Nematocida displodere]